MGHAPRGTTAICAHNIAFRFLFHLTTSEQACNLGPMLRSLASLPKTFLHCRGKTVSLQFNSSVFPGKIGRSRKVKPKHDTYFDCHNLNYCPPRMEVFQLRKQMHTIYVHLFALYIHMPKNFSVITNLALIKHFFSSYMNPQGSVSFRLSREAVRALSFDPRAALSNCRTSKLIALHLLISASRVSFPCC